jgi:hypothetical protein
MCHLSPIFEAVAGLGLMGRYAPDGLQPRYFLCKSYAALASSANASFPEASHLNCNHGYSPIFSGKCSLMSQPAESGHWPVTFFGWEDYNFGAV